MLTTFRLSSKHQVTIPAEGRSLLPEDGKAFSGLAHAVPKVDAVTGAEGERFPVLVLFAPQELARREGLIRADATLSPLERDRRATQLRATARTRAMDEQNRVVLPEVWVQHLQLDKEVFFVCLNESLRVWNPEHFRRWSGLDDSGVDPSLSAYLLA